MRQALDYLLAKRLNRLRMRWQREAMAGSVDYGGFAGDFALGIRRKQGGGDGSAPAPALSTIGQRARILNFTSSGPQSDNLWRADEPAR